MPQLAGDVLTDSYLEDEVLVATLLVGFSNFIRLPAGKVVSNRISRHPLLFLVPAVPSWWPTPA